MDFIIGGCFQGKREYVKRQYSFGENDIISAADINNNDTSGKAALRTSTSTFGSSWSIIKISKKTSAHFSKKMTSVS